MEFSVWDDLFQKQNQVNVSFLNENLSFCDTGKWSYKICMTLVFMYDQVINSGEGLQRKAFKPKFRYVI